MNIQKNALPIYKVHRETRKFNDWCKYFLDKNNKESYGNATVSALKVYKTSSYSSAGVIGHENLKKLKNLAVIAIEELGYSFHKLMEIGIQKVKTGRYDDWEKFMMLLGYFDNDKSSLQQISFNQINIGPDIQKSRLERGLPV